MGRREGLKAIVVALAVCVAPAGLAQTSKAPPRYLETPAGAKPRVVITADPELDDNNSLIRYLLYSTDYRTEGLIYASSQFHWKGDGKDTRLSVPGREYTRFGLHICPCTSWRWDPHERFIDDAVAAYTAAYPNLRVHDRDYPSPTLLKSKIRWGNVAFDGEMAKDTPGSDLIKSLLLDREEAPIYLHAWGGQSTIARALKSIEEQYQGTPQWPAIRAQVIRKAVIHPSGDQDDSYAHYIKPHWPEIRYRQQAGGVPLGYNAQAMVSEADAAYFTPAWMSENVVERGPLGARERVWGDGKQMVKGDIFDYFGIADTPVEDLRKQGYIVWTPPHAKGAFLGEGDTHTFLNLIDNGLRGYRGDSFGGWGGYARSGPPDGGFGLAMVEAAANSPDGLRRPIVRAATHPFLAAAQRDWAARFKWAVTPVYAGANHNPVITLAGPHQLRARAGQRIALSVRTSDPDGDAVSVKWWIWKEAGSYKGDIALAPDAGERGGFAVPADAAPGDQIQLIAEATDNGAPALTRYEKVVVTVVR
ncbi:DUF1593 domain-containing protein [Sphingomonas sp. MMSM20]|uniref:DUF1593 domain-containing protein n=1 Tax=Sphingomonas lycopersici TaxID=2951807 RepID=UPI002238DFCB|nr:DUF1593 domain-containing protein [Sphingomonas lycopersici]